MVKTKNAHPLLARKKIVNWVKKVCFEGPTKIVNKPKTSGLIVVEALIANIH